MSEFCKQCSIEVFGEDFKDMVGVTSAKSWKEGLAGWELCEGCGMIQVDPEGQCASPHCSKKGQEGHNVPWAK